MSIRAALAEDAHAIARVHVDSWRTTYAHLLPKDFLSQLSYTSREEFWRNVLSSPERQGYIFVADESASGVTGFASGGPQRTEGTHFKGELYAIYLLATRQRHGIGRQLVAAVAKRLLQDRIRSMLVWVLADNPARKFYEALGGKYTGEKEIIIADTRLREVAYGWEDIRPLATYLDSSSNTS